MNYIKKGYLIVFTGIDGSGKTTQANVLVESLKQDNLCVSYVWSRWEPLLLRPFIKRWKSKIVGVAELNAGGSTIKIKKQRMLSNPLFRWLWLTLFFIDYGFQIVRKIRLRLLKKQIIISDRIFYDSVIDQAINLGKRREWLLDSLDSFWIKIIFPIPDLVIYVDCPEDIAFSRKKEADIEYLAERRKLYTRLARKYDWIIVDGTLSADEVAVQIKDAVYKKISFLNITQ